jgi:pyruvate dehydrogenase E1 component beta subunit
VTYDLYKKYGEFRLLDTPICEYSFMVRPFPKSARPSARRTVCPSADRPPPLRSAQGMGVGAAMTGLRPIVEGMNMGFLLLAFSQISNNAGMLHYTSGGNFKVPMVIRGPGGASAAVRGTHSTGVC